MRSNRYRPRLPLVPVLLCLTMTACGGPSPQPQGEDPSIIRWGGDVVAGGSELAVTDSIDGDVIVAGGEVAFSGVAAGDVLGAGGTLVLDGRVLGDVRAAGGEVRLTGQVARNLAAAGREVLIAQGATVGRNAYLAGQQLRVDGVIDGSLRAAGAAIVLNGTVQGDVDVRGGSLRLGPTARITGDLTHRVPTERVAIDPGAQVGGSVTAHPAKTGAPISLVRVLLMLGFLLAGAVAVALFPDAAASAEAGLRRKPLLALGFGLLWLIVVPIAILAVAITGVGVPLALILLALSLICVYLARAVVAVWIGRSILRRQPREGRGGIVSAFLVGGVILLLLGLIPLVGGLIGLVATVLGLGAFAVAWRERSA